MSLPPPSDELKALVALEQGSDVDPGTARERLAQRLAVQMNPGLEAPSKATRPSTTTEGRSFPRMGVTRFAQAALFGAGVATGAGLRSLVPPSPLPAQVRYVDRPEAVRPANAPATNDAASPTRTPEVEALPAPSLAPPQVSASPRRPEKQPSPPAAASGATSDEELGHERQLIERAQSALARRNAAAALQALDQHARDFPHGQLAEMREALAVQALVSAGRGTDAHARGERFHRLFPGSMYRPVVDGALSSIP